MYIQCTSSVSSHNVSLGKSTTYCTPILNLCQCNPTMRLACNLGKSLLLLWWRGWPVSSTDFNTMCHRLTTILSLQKSPQWVRKWGLVFLECTSNPSLSNVISFTSLSPPLPSPHLLAYCIHHVITTSSVGALISNCPQQERQRKTHSLPASLCLHQ